MKIPYGKQWINDEDIDTVTEVMKSDFLTTGPTVKKFEDKFSSIVSSKYAVAVSSGTAALHLSAQVLDVKENSEVITTPMTFAATSNCILYNKGKVIYSDITGRGLINPQEIELQITSETVGVIPVHYMGLPADLEHISKIAKENDLFTIEDACHALGAKYKDSRIGDCKYSDLAVFSFHPVKHITTGEGGIITTNSKSLYDKLLQLRTHGITKNKSKFKTEHTEPWYHEMHNLGFNYRLTDIQAALGLSQLSRLDEFVQRRREIANKYLDFFNEIGDNFAEPITERESEYNSYHLFVIKLMDPNKRRSFFEYLMKKEIYCQIHYIPTYWHPYYRENGYNGSICPKAEDFYNRIISLPMYPALEDNQLEYVLDCIKEFQKI